MGHGWDFYSRLVNSMMYNRTVGGTRPGSVPWNDQDAPYGSEFKCSASRPRDRHATHMPSYPTTYGSRAPHAQLLRLTKPT